MDCVNIHQYNTRLCCCHTMSQVYTGFVNAVLRQVRSDNDGLCQKVTVHKLIHFFVADPFRRKRRFVLSGRHLGRSMMSRGSKPGRPSRLTQSASSSSLRDALRRQNSRADFDINNVVIPYGATAAATLIDRHEYKEIITPK